MQISKKHGYRTWGSVFASAVLLGMVALPVGAQTLRINTRPLTPQEKTDYGLPSATQIANGTPVVGLGQPVYLELLITKGTVVTQAVWSLVSVLDEDNLPVAHTATITNSPLPSAMPTYDIGDQNNMTVVDRAMIVPDAKGTYTISAQVKTTSKTITSSIKVVGSVFLGKDYVACTLCHASKQAGFNATGHATAFIRKINDPASGFKSTCISCHAVGYDTTPGAVNSGFDDVATSLGWTFPATLASTNWDSMPLALQQKSNVQCENCHGPAQEHLRSGGDTSKIGISLGGGNCGQCHDKMTHHSKNFEWKISPHGSGAQTYRTGSCAVCHSARGYIDANDPGINEMGVTNLLASQTVNGGTGNEGITCAACHDPHSPGNGAHQLRKIDSVTLANTNIVITTGGDGLVCMACHHDRRKAADADIGSYPHHSPQTDMLFGKNAVEYGQNMPSSRHWDVVEDTCAQCHMQETPADIPAYAQNKVGGHTFKLVYDDGTNDVIYLTETCKTCHGDIGDFNFGGADYDQDGVVEGVQQEISDMLVDLAMLLPPYGANSVDTSLISKTDPAQLKLRKAAYNYLFVMEDRSLGVHNPKYASALLRSSIDDLKGGIDIDHDGLEDSWEIANFGDLTSQSGTDDADGDGLNNIAEKQLGTDPNKADTDNDGFSDLVEMQAGSNPLSASSVPTSDMLILPAKEVGYLPKGTNATIQFQSIDKLVGGGWMDLGAAQTNVVGWAYQLDSLRGTTNRFYRAIEQ